jgi:phosphate transport system permease protein
MDAGNGRRVLKMKFSSDADLYNKEIPENLRIREYLVKVLLGFFSIISISITLGIVYILSVEAVKFFSDGGISLKAFFTGTEWQPVIKQFGILPLATSTLLTSTIAMAVAAPLGIFAAIYMSEYAGAVFKSRIKPVLEILAGIPTIVYGYFALTFITPVLKHIFGPDVVDVYNTGSAGLAMGILIFPMIASMSEDALSAVPSGLRQAAYGLGATKLEVSTGIILPSAMSGIMASLIMGLSRAVGETMIVALAAGAGSNLTLNPLKSAETMTGYIARISGGDVGYDTVDYNSIFSIGILLFIITLVLNLVSQRVVAKYREIYD